jgi:hypothetical protein
LVPNLELPNNKKRKHTDYRNCIFKDDVKDLKKANDGKSLEADDWCSTNLFAGCKNCRTCHPKKEKDDYCNGDGLHRIYRGLNIGLVLASFGAVVAAMWAHVGNGIVGI